MGGRITRMRLHLHADHLNNHLNNHPNDDLARREEYRQWLENIGLIDDDLPVEDDPEDDDAPQDMDFLNLGNNFDVAGGPDVHLEF